MSAICILEGIILRNRIRNDQQKKPLVITARVKRLFVTNFILYLIPIVVFIITFNEDNIYLYYIIVGLMIYLNYIMAYI